MPRPKVVQMPPPESWTRAQVTLGIVALTAGAWLLASLLHRQEWAVVWGGFIPARLAYGGDGMLAPFWLTPLTATLVHGGIFHLTMNLLILAFCGRPVEAVLGGGATATLYLLGAYAAAGAHYAITPLSAIPMVGASGAVSALIGAYAMLFGRNKVRLANPRLALWANALWLLVAWVVMQVALGIALAGPSFLSGDGMGIAVGAHVGGFVVGLLLANPLLLFRYRRA